MRRRRRSLVRNAADPSQVGLAKRTESRRGDERFVLVQTQLGTYAGREFVWSLIEACGIHDLVTGPNDDVREFLGRRRVGITLFLEITQQHPDAYLLMHEEALGRLTRDDRELDAAHQAAQGKDV